MYIPPGIERISDGPIHTFEAPNAETFLGAISPVTGFASKSVKRHWIYRGHADSEWTLLPSSRRVGAWPLPMAVAKPDTLRNRVATEAIGLLSFCEIADRQGLVVPGFHNNRSFFLSMVAAKPELWPPHEALHALALAQHNGLQTCLLDFTRDPLVAAYFAARGATQKDSNSPQLCVWAIQDGRLTLTHESPVHRLKLLVPPASDNQTLQRQQGLFVYERLPDGIPSESEYVPQSPLEDHWRSDSAAQSIKLVLRTALAGELLRLLIRLGYESARFFPTYFGAVESVMEYQMSRTGPPL